MYKGSQLPFDQQYYSLCIRQNGAAYIVAVPRVCLAHDVLAIRTLAPRQGDQGHEGSCDSDETRLLDVYGQLKLHPAEYH